MRIFLALLLILFASQAHADIPLSGLPAASSVSTTDSAPLVQSGPTDRKATVSLIFQGMAAGIDTICSVSPLTCGAFFNYVSPRWYGGYCDSNFNANNNFHDDSTGIQAALNNSGGYPTIIPIPGCKIASPVTINRHGTMLFSLARPGQYSGTSTFGSGPTQPYIYLPDTMAAQVAVNTNGYDSNGFYNLLVKGSGISKGASFVNRNGGTKGGNSAQFSDFNNISCADLGTCLGYPTEVQSGSVLCNPTAAHSNDNLQWFLHNIHTSSSCFGIIGNITDAILTIAYFANLTQNCIATFNGTLGYNGSASGVRCEYSGYSAFGGSTPVYGGGAGIYYNSSLGMEVSNFDTDHITGAAIDIGTQANNFYLTNGYAGSSQNGVNGPGAQINIESGAKNIYISNFNPQFGTLVPCGIKIGTGVDYLQILGGSTTGGSASTLCWTGTYPAHMNIQILGTPFLQTGQTVAIGTGLPRADFDIGSLGNAYIPKLIAPSGSSTPLVIQPIAGLITGTTAYYKLDDASGSTAVDAVSAANGTWSGTLGSQWTTGIINGGGLFNGTNNFVSTTYTGVLGSAARSISLWFKTTTSTIAGNSTQLLYYGSAFNGQNIVLATNDKYGGATNYNGITFEGGACGITYSNATNIYDGNWHFVVMTLAAGKTCGDPLIYLDGALLTTVVHSLSTSTVIGTGSSKSVNIGGSSLGSDFPGSIDEVGLWSRVLSPSEITSLYNAGAGNQYPFSGGVAQNANLINILNQAGASAAEFDGAGRLGIGTTAPTSLLTLTGLGTSAPIGTTTGALYMCIDSNGGTYRKASCP